MLKVMTVVGTRPEIIKMSRVISAFDSLAFHILVHTGQNYDYELNEIFFDQLEIRKPDYFLEAQQPSPMGTIAKVLERVDGVIAAEKPDAFLVYGDTNSCLSVIAAKRRKVPVFHMEAGNRCFDQNVPEELNRRIVDHLSDINIVLSEHARRNLLNEGLPADRIIKSGSHMKEVLDYYSPKIQSSDALERLGLERNGYILVSIHREENVDAPGTLGNLIKTLEAVTGAYGLPIIVSTHPRTRSRLEGLGIQTSKLIRFVKPFGFLDYVNLQINAYCILSDSGTITEEASILDLPAITLRSAHERPEGMDEGTLIMSTIVPTRVLEAISVVKQTQGRASFGRLVPDYDVTNVSTKILRAVYSYVDFVNRVVWQR